MNRKQVATKIYDALEGEYPKACCTLRNENPVQFLVANILSSQCTDAIASKVSIKLWDKYKSAEKIVAASLKDIAEIIRPAGFYNVKSRYIKSTMKILVDKYDGRLPDKLKDLVVFPGIGRKLALVLLSEVYGKVEGIVIDTHNIRLSQRIGLVNTKSPEKIEHVLMKLIPKSKWRMWSHYMVYHGRAVCTARSPKCCDCVISQYCKSNGCKK